MGGVLGAMGHRLPPAPICANCHTRALVSLPVFTAACELLSPSFHWKRVSQIRLLFFASVSQMDSPTTRRQAESTVARERDTPAWTL